MSGDPCRTTSATPESDDVTIAALRRAAGLARSARNRPGESFITPVHKSAVDAVVAYLKRDEFIVRVGPHGTDSPRLCTVSVVWPKDRFAAVTND